MPASHPQTELIGLRGEPGIRIFSQVYIQIYTVCNCIKTQCPFITNTSPIPRQQLICFLPYQTDLLLLECCRNEVIPYVAFWVWLLSLSIMAEICTRCCLTVVWYFLLLTSIPGYRCTSLFIPSLVVFFHFLVIINKATINIYIQVSVRT